MINLQIGDNDLVGNRFNGHDLHLHLRARNIESNHLVWKKRSDDENTHEIHGSYPSKGEINALYDDINNKFSSQAQFYRFSLSLFDHPLFNSADVVHFHLIHNYFFNISHFPLYTQAKPVVWTLHDPWAMTGHCIYPAGCRRWEIGCGNCPDLNLQFAIKDDTSALNWETKFLSYSRISMDIVVASKYMLNMANKSRFFENSRKHLVPFGLDLTKFRPSDALACKQKYGIDGDEVVLCFRNVGSQYKGIEYIFELLDRLNVKQKVCLLTFNDVGNLERYNSKYKIVELGWVTDEAEIIDAYNATDIFLMPSKEEAFGMMAMEAMACGKPVVVMSETSLEEIVYPELGGGIVVPQADVYGFTRSVEELINNQGKRESLGSSARNVAEVKYNLTRYLDDITSVYETAIKEHGELAKFDSLMGK